MSIITEKITAFFTDTGVPATGLSPTIRIRELAGDTLVITDAAMAEVGDGFYRYNFAAYDTSVDYAFRCDGTNTLPAAERYVSFNTHGQRSNIYHADRNAALVESQRDGHTWQGNIFYVDPFDGDTHASGNRGSRFDPYGSVQDCHDNAIIDSNHDVIILVSGDAGPTTLTENAVLSKRYLFIRGPGRDFLWTRSGAGDTVQIIADGIELSGFQLATAAIGSGDGVQITGADFVKLRDIYINGTRGHGIHISNSTYAIIANCSLDGTGQGGAGHGINIDPSGGASNHCVIRRNSGCLIIRNNRY